MAKLGLNLRAFLCQPGGQAHWLADSSRNKARSRGTIASCPSVLDKEPLGHLLINRGVHQGMAFQGPSLDLPLPGWRTLAPLPLPLMRLSQSSFLVNLLNPHVPPSPWTLTAPYQLHNLCIASPCLPSSWSSFLPH